LEIQNRLSFSTGDILPSNQVTINDGPFRAKKLTLLLKGKLSLDTINDDGDVPIARPTIRIKRIRALSQFMTP
jgi:hypothetical protein